MNKNIKKDVNHIHKWHTQDKHGGLHYDENMINYSQIHCSVLTLYTCEILN